MKKYSLTYQDKRGAGIAHYGLSLDDVCARASKLRVPANVKCNGKQAGEVFQDDNGTWLWVIDPDIE